MIVGTADGRDLGRLELGRDAGLGQGFNVAFQVCPAMQGRRDVKRMMF